MHEEQSLAAAHLEVFDALDEAFCVVEMMFDNDGRPVDYRFLECNRAFADHTGLSDLLGRTARDVLPLIERRWIDTYGTVARSRTPIRFVDEVSAIRRWFEVYAWPFGRPEGLQVAVHFTDITHRKLAEDELFVRSQQFYTLVAKAPIGVTLLDANLRIVQANPAAQKMFGNVGDIVGRDYAEFLREVWPQDVASEVAGIARKMLLTGASHYDAEMAVRHADRGVTEYFDWRMDQVRLACGLDGLVGYFIDTTKQTRARHALVASENRYRTLIESIEEGFAILEVVVDDQDRPFDYRFVEVNPAFARHFGFDVALGRTIAELMPNVGPFWLDAFGRVVRTGAAMRLVTNVEPLDRWLDVYAFLVEERHEHKVAVLLSDVTEQKRAEHALQESVELLRHRANHDALTGLPNRLMFEARLKETVSNADRHGRPFAVLFLDLDGFKAINDDLGHEGGDVVLIEIARRLRRSLRAGDFLARIHGDEFVLLLPEMSAPNEAGGVAEKLLEIVRAPLEVAATKVRVHASIGVGMYPTDGATARAVLRAADAAMYSAKAGGKNAVGYVIAASAGGAPSDVERADPSPSKS